MLSKIKESANFALWISLESVAAIYGFKEGKNIFLTYKTNTMCSNH